MRGAYERRTIPGQAIPEGIVTIVIILEVKGGYPVIGHHKGGYAT